MGGTERGEGVGVWARWTAGKLCGLAALTALLPVAVAPAFVACNIYEKKNSAARHCLPLFE